MRAPRLSSWWATLGVLVAVRVAIPLAAHADSGSKLPGLPRWTYDGFTGDATSFYAGAREFIAAWGRMPRPLLAVVGIRGSRRSSASSSRGGAGRSSAPGSSRWRSSCSGSRSA
jgi:hypothetical protein